MAGATAVTWSVRISGIADQRFRPRPTSRLLLTRRPAVRGGGNAYPTRARSRRRRFRHGDDYLPDRAPPWVDLAGQDSREIGLVDTRPPRELALTQLPSTPQQID